MSRNDLIRRGDIEGMLALMVQGGKLSSEDRDSLKELLGMCSVVKLVCCEDCEYWPKATVNKKGYLICPASGMEITYRDFCSYGERREE